MTAEERVVLNALLPEVLTFVTGFKVELNSVLVVSLWNKKETKYGYNAGKRVDNAFLWMLDEKTAVV